MSKNERRPRRRKSDFVFPIFAAAATAAAFLLYANAAPAWAAGATLVLPPALWCAKRLDQSRLLAGIFVAAAPLTIYESVIEPGLSTQYATTPTYESTLMQLYPERPEAAFERIRQTAICQFESEAQGAPGCAEVEAVPLEEIDALLQQVLSSRSRVNDRMAVMGRDMLQKRARPIQSAE